MSAWLKNLQRNQELVALFQKLGSTRLVVDQTGVKMRTLAYILRAAGIPTPRKGRRHNPYAACDRHAELLLEMNSRGCSLAEMAKVAGTNDREVRKFLRRHGETREFSKAVVGERHYAWKGRTVDKDGYILVHVKGHPNSRKHTHYIFEHRLVMEAHLGRLLERHEVVHHKDGNKQNNAIENLQLFQSNGEHLAVDLKGRKPNWTPEGEEKIRKSRYQPKRTWRGTIRGGSKDDAPLCI
jgi:hypothetical protein